MSIAHYKIMQFLVYLHEKACGFGFKFKENEAGLPNYERYVKQRKKEKKNK